MKISLILTAAFLLFKLSWATPQHVGDTGYFEVVGHSDDSELVSLELEIAGPINQTFQRNFPKTSDHIENFSYTFTRSGSYRITARSIDSRGLQDETVQTVSLLNRTPNNLQLTSSNNQPTIDDSITLSSSANDDDTNLLSLELWVTEPGKSKARVSSMSTPTSGGVATLNNSFSYQFNYANGFGNYEFELKAIDSEGAEATYSLSMNPTNPTRTTVIKAKAIPTSDKGIWFDSSTVQQETIEVRKYAQ